MTKPKTFFPPTGINTGSVYKDFGLLKNGFPGECVVNSSVIVVKTHERGPAAHQGYDKAVLLVRDPTQAIQAEFNRQGGGHIGFASPDRYKIGKGKCKCQLHNLIKPRKLDSLLNTYNSKRIIDTFNVILRR